MINIFSNIDIENKDKLLKMIEADIFTFKKGLTILSRSKNDNTFFIILSGCIQIIRNDYNGNRIITNELYENDVFGSTILSVSNNEYDIFTKEDTKIAIIEYDRVILKDYNDCSFYNTFIKNLLQITSNKMKLKNERIEILTKKTIRNRLLEYFKIESKKSGSKKIYLQISFTELAEYLATDRSAMTRELKNLKDEGFIEITGKKITLLY